MVRGRLRGGVVAVCGSAVSRVAHNEYASWHGDGDRDGGEGEREGEMKELDSHMDDGKLASSFSKIRELWK
jgi:hypothetical protein